MTVTTQPEDDKKRLITVCDYCLRASCRQGRFFCEKSDTAGTVDRTIADLEALNLENSDYWKEPQE